MIKSISILAVTLLMFCSCQESLEERAQREAKEYTAKNCPTPKQNGTILDSLVFDKNTHTFAYYYRCCDKSDVPNVPEDKKQQLFTTLVNGLKAGSDVQSYVDADFNFRYVYRSNSNPQNIIIDLTVKASDLKK